MKDTDSTIVGLSLIGFLGIFSTTISKNPVLPLFAHQLGASDSLIGTISAVSPLSGILLSFPVGVLSDRISKKKLLVISSLIFLSAPLLYLCINNPLCLIPVRFFHGMATAILGPLASTIICSSCYNDKGKRLGIYSSSTLIARSIAPLFGGIIISFFAGGGHLFNYRLVYVAAFLSAVPVLIFAFLYHDVPGTERSTVEQKDLQPFFSAFKNFFSHPLLVATGGIEMAAYFCFGVIETFLPVHLIKNGISAGSIGVLFSLQVVSIALSKPFFGTMADHHDKRPHILLGLLVVGITTGIMAAVPSVVWLAVANMIFGLGFSLCTVSSSTYVAEIADRDQLGSSMGALSSIMDIGHSSGPLITGFIVMYTSISFGCVCSSVLAFLAVLYFFVYTHRKASSKFS